MNDKYVDMKYEVWNKRDHITCKLMTEDIEVCRCEISVAKRTGTWNISEWFTNSKFMHQGIGKETMRRTLHYCMDTYGNPASITYTWNGANEYVIKWLEKEFDAFCTCPIAVQKTQADDDWDSHVYDLNKEKVLKYFELIA